MAVAARSAPATEADRTSYGLPFPGEDREIERERMTSVRHT